MTCAWMSGSRAGVASMKIPPRRIPALFGRDRLVFALQGSVQGVPGQGGTLDPDGKLPHAAKHRQLAKRRRAATLRGLARYQILKAAKQRFRLSTGLTLEALGHHRG